MSESKERAPVPAYGEGSVDDYMERLCAPFEPGVVGFLCRGSGTNRLGMPYIESRHVMARLDGVVGRANWNFGFSVLAEGVQDGKARIVMRGVLTVMGVAAEDIGEAEGESELYKSAVSDTLKRCAVHFGIGRYLYNLPPAFGKWDDQRKTWAEWPRYKPEDIARAVAWSLDDGRPKGQQIPPQAPATRHAKGKPESAHDPKTGDEAEKQKDGMPEELVARLREAGETLQWKNGVKLKCLSELVGRELSAVTEIRRDEWPEIADRMEETVKIRESVVLAKPAYSTRALPKSEWEKLALAKPAQRASRPSAPQQTDTSPHERARKAFQGMGWSGDVLAVQLKSLGFGEELSDQDWRKAAVQVEALVHLKAGVFKRFAELCKYENLTNDSQTRLDMFSGWIDREIESTSHMTKREWETVAARIHELMQESASEQPDLFLDD